MLLQMDLGLLGARYSHHCCGFVRNLHSPAVLPRDASVQISSCTQQHDAGFREGLPESGHARYLTCRVVVYWDSSLRSNLEPFASLYLVLPHRLRFVSLSAINGNRLRRRQVEWVPFANWLHERVDPKYKRCVLLRCPCCRLNRLTRPHVSSTERFPL